MTLDEIRMVRSLMERLTYEYRSVPDDLLLDLAMISASVPQTLFSEIDDRKDGMSSYEEDSSL